MYFDFEDKVSGTLGTGERHDMLGGEGWRVFLVVMRSLREQGPWEDLCMGTRGGGYEYGLGWDQDMGMLESKGKAPQRMRDAWQGGGPAGYCKILPTSFPRFFPQIYHEEGER